MNAESPTAVLQYLDGLNASTTKTGGLSKLRAAALKQAAGLRDTAEAAGLTGGRADRALAVADLLLEPSVLRRSRGDSARVAASLPLWGRLSVAVATGVLTSKRDWERQVAARDSRLRNLLLTWAGEAGAHPMASCFFGMPEDPAEYSPSSRATSPVADHLGDLRRLSQLGVPLATELLARAAILDARAGAVPPAKSVERKLLDRVVENAVDYSTLNRVPKGTQAPTGVSPLRRLVVQATAVGGSLPAPRRRKLLNLLGRAPSELPDDALAQWVDCLLVVAVGASAGELNKILTSRPDAHLLRILEIGAQGGNSPALDSARALLAARPLDGSARVRWTRLEARRNPASEASSTPQVQVELALGELEEIPAERIAELWSSVRARHSPGVLVQLASRCVARLRSAGEAARSKALTDEWRRLRDLVHETARTIAVEPETKAGWFATAPARLAEELTFSVPKPASVPPDASRAKTGAALDDPRGIEELGRALAIANERGDPAGEVIEATLRVRIRDAAERDPAAIGALAVALPDLRLVVFEHAARAGTERTDRIVRDVITQVPASAAQWTAVALDVAEGGQVRQLPHELAAPVIDAASNEVARLGRLIADPSGYRDVSGLYEDVRRTLTSALTRVQAAATQVAVISSILHSAIDDVTPRRN